MKLAVVLFNLGGPDSLDAVEPFLKNLFADPAIIRLPSFLRIPLARWIARRRAPVARAIYERIGGSSPILAETSAQADALQSVLNASTTEARVFIAMRASPPQSGEAAAAVAAWAPDKIVLLPLYPQFSTTTTASSLIAWQEAAARCGLTASTARVCCYPSEEGFVKAQVELIRDALRRRKGETGYRVLFSAHGLPLSIANRGDPYRWQVERSVRAIVQSLAEPGLDWRICFQSRVGPLKWLEPATDAEIRLAGTEGKGLIVVPIAFVSEHSETLVELDMEYAALAQKSGVPDYIRVPAVGVHPCFIAGLANLVQAAARGSFVVTCDGGRICSAAASQCGYGCGVE